MPGRSMDNIRKRWKKAKKLEESVDAAPAHEK
jgi:hypothetical protein